MDTSRWRRYWRPLDYLYRRRFVFACPRTEHSSTSRLGFARTARSAQTQGLINCVLGGKGVAPSLPATNCHRVGTSDKLTVRCVRPRPSLQHITQMAPAVLMHWM